MDLGRIGRCTWIGALVLFVGCSISCTGDDPCGNGEIDLDAGESCDGTNLGGRTCFNYAGFGDFPGGKLACNNQCLVDTSNCEPCYGYPCKPWGTLPGEVMNHESFIPGNEIAMNMAVDASFDLSDVYRDSVAHGGHLKGMLMFVSTEWCGYCPLEAQLLNSIYAEYKDQGIIVVGLILEDANFDAADAEDANGYAEKYSWRFPAVAGPLKYAYWLPVGYPGAVPLNIFVDLRTMKIYHTDIGAYRDFDEVRPTLDELVKGPVWYQTVAE